MDGASADYEILPSPDKASSALAFIVKGPTGELNYAYKYMHPHVAATVVVRDRSRDAYLLTRRTHAPYDGQFVFPGGFLDVGEESVDQTAARELREEALIEVSPEQLTLIDVRSDPARDPRDHIIDVGYYAEVDAAEASTGDEVSEVLWAKAEEIDGMALGFDHSLLWRNVRAYLNRQKSDAARE